MQQLVDRLLRYMHSRIAHPNERRIGHSSLTEYRVDETLDRERTKAEAEFSSVRLRAEIDAMGRIGHDSVAEYRVDVTPEGRPVRVKAEFSALHWRVEIDATGVATEHDGTSTIFRWSDLPDDMDDTKLAAPVGTALYQSLYEVLHFPMASRGPWECFHAPGVFALFLLSALIEARKSDGGAQAGLV